MANSLDIPDDAVTDISIPDSEVVLDSKNNSSLPMNDSVEQQISGRQDILSGLIDRIKSEPQSFSQVNPLSNLRAGLELVGGVGQRAESSIANLLGEVQKGSDNQKLLNSFLDGATGKVLGQYGDLVRRTGVGGGYNEALASTGGLLASLASFNLASGGKVGKVAYELGGEASALGKKIAESGKSTLTGIEQAAKDAITHKTGFLQDLRSAFYEAKDSAVQKFGEGLDQLVQDNPQTKVNLRPVIDELNQSIAIDPKIRNAVSKVQALSAMLDEPSLANSVPLKDAQNLVNMLQSRVSSGKLQGIGVRPDDIPLLDVIHDSKYQMVEAFPQLKELRKGYADVIQKFNALRGKFKGVGSDALEKNIKSGFGGTESKNAVKELLNESPEILSRLRNYARLRTAGSILSKVGLFGAGAETIHLLK